MVVKKLLNKQKTMKVLIVILVSSLLSAVFIPTTAAGEIVTGSWTENLTSSGVTICWDTVAISDSILSSTQWIYAFRLVLRTSGSLVLDREVSPGYYKDYYGNWYLSEIRSSGVNGLNENTLYYYEITYWLASGMDPGSLDSSTKQYIDDPLTGTFTTLASYTPPPGGGTGCPYILPWNGSAYNYDNVILINSEIHDDVTITDYMKIESASVPIDGKYSFVIQEYEKERTQLDAAELITVDHPEDVEVAVDSYGDIITYSDPVPPDLCVDKYGNNVTSKISYIDNYNIEGYDGDYIIMDFGRITAQHTKLLIRSDVKPGSGGIFPYTNPENENKGITISIKSKNDTWVNISHFYPREKWYTDVFVLDPYLSNASQPLQIAIGWLDYHKIDWVALDTTSDAPVDINNYYPINCVFKENNITQKISNVDGDAVILVPRESVCVEFPYEEPKTAMVRDIIFVSTGRYDTIPREENIGFDVYQFVKMSVSIKGKPGNTVRIDVLEDGNSVSNISITREKRNPHDNIQNISFKKYMNRKYELRISNEGEKGSNKIEVKLISVFAGSNETETYKIKAGRTRTVSIDEKLDGILSGDRVFFFELSPPYYEIPSEWISEIYWDFGNGWWSYNTEDFSYYAYSGTYSVTLNIEYRDGVLITLTKTIRIT